MATILAQTIIDRAELVLNDSTNVRWSVAELLGWLNDAQREIVALRPDAYSRTTNLLLVAGTRQTIPSDGYSLLNVVRNMGADGLTPGQAVRKVSRDLLDAQEPNWHGANATTTVDNYVFDPRDPRNFYVYPPSAGAVRVEILYSAAPPDVAAVGDVITLDDIYAGPILDLILYRAYNKDAEMAGAAARALAHRQAAENTLGLKALADGASSPAQRAAA